MMNKTELRDCFSQKRSSITDAAVKSGIITEKLLSLDAVKEADLVLCYVSVGSETETSGLIQKLIAAGKKVAVPKCKGKGKGIMNFYAISSANDLINGKYNIPEPDVHCCEAQLTDKTVCIVPGLSFTLSGFRLGYGGGYYDRFLSTYPQIYSIGITFDTLISAELPVQPHDISVNAILTEERTVLCSEE